MILPSTGIGIVSYPTHTRDRILTDWIICSNSERYFLAGVVKIQGNEPALAQGATIRYTNTGYIKTASGRKVTTESSSIYHLEGEPNPSSITLLNAKGLIYDPINPLHFLEGQ